MKRINLTPPVETISIDSIDYDDKAPRKDVKTLAQQLSDQGQTNAIIVSREPSGKIRLESGLNGLVTLEAAISAGWKQIRAVVIPIEDARDEQLIKVWCQLIEGRFKQQLDSYSIAQAAVNLEEKFKVRGSEFARQLGLTPGYTYNLMRWFRAVPNKIKEEWRKQHPSINQAELERYSHLPKDEALRLWDQRLKMLTTTEPFKPGRKSNGEQQEYQRKTRRISEKQILKLQAAVDESALARPVKALITNILRFVIGAEKDVAGITDYKKLDLSLIEVPAVVPKTKDGKEQPHV